MNGAAEIIRLWADGGVPCLFHMFTGLYCPGCGGTRAVKALLQGKPVLSFLYHPLVLYCALMAVLFSLSWFLYWRTGKPRYRLYLENRYIYVGVGLTAVNFIVKNYCLVVLGKDLLSMLPPV